jgi:hypothetical protein
MRFLTTLSALAMWNSVGIARDRPRMWKRRARAMPTLIWGLGVKEHRD